MTQKPTLFVCHGDDGGPRMHPCRRVQEALRAAGIQYEKVVAAHGSPIPFLRKGSRDELRQATGTTKLPTLKLPDGTVITTPAPSSPGSAKTNHDLTRTVRGSNPIGVGRSALSPRPSRAWRGHSCSAMWVA
jgi:hypothetical protein